MKQPEVAGHGPKEAKLEQDTNYVWCVCGRSNNGQFCDGSHRGTGFNPLKFKAEKTCTAYLCMCKQTKTPPYCDGSHKHLPQT